MPVTTGNSLSRYFPFPERGHFRCLLEKKIGPSTEWTGLSSAERGATLRNKHHICMPEAPPPYKGILLGYLMRS